MESQSKSSDPSRIQNLFSRLPVPRFRKSERGKTDDLGSLEAAEATAARSEAFRKDAETARTAMIAKATEALVRLFLKPHDLNSQSEVIQQGGQSSTQPLDYFTTLCKLLEDGADLNVVICAYKFQHRTLHRLLHAESDGDFFEDTFESCLKENLIAIESNSMVDNVSQHLAALRTPFTLAAYLNDERIIPTLLDYGARLEKSFDLMNRIGARPGLKWELNPFVPAIEKNDTNLFRLTLKYTASASNKTRAMISRQLTALMNKSLMIAQEHEHDFSVASLILQSNVTISLMSFPDSPTRETIDFMISQNLAFHMLRRETQGDILPLVVFLDHPRLYDEIINKKQYLDLMRKRPASICMTTLHIACGNLTTIPCKSLSAASHFVNVKDTYGMSPLLEAVYYGNIEAVHILLERGANAADVVCLVPRDKPMELPNIPLIAGPWRPTRDMAAHLFKVNEWSAIHIAAHRGYSRILELLIARGADVAAVDKSLRSALDIALDASNISIAYMLLDHNCPFDVQSKAASKLLSQAIEECKHEEIEILLALGVSVPDDAQLATYERYKSGLSTNPYTKLNELLKAGPNQKRWVASNICEDCSLALEKETSKPINRLLNPNCHLCRLFEDSAEEERFFQGVVFVHDDGAPDRELRLHSSAGSSSHPMRMIPCTCQSIILVGLLSLYAR